VVLDGTTQAAEHCICHLCCVCLPNAASRRAVSKGDRVAQLILECIATPEVLEVTDLEATIRGAGGYGSTGVGAA